jgi:hypothetical protein
MPTIGALAGPAFMHPPVPADPDLPTRPEVEAHEWQRARASLEMARATRQPLRLCEALSEIGRCERRSGQADLAAAHFDDALRWARVLGTVDLLADLLCERGELAADAALDEQGIDHAADPDAWLQARACAAEAASLASRTSDPEWEVKLLLRASDLFNRLGSSVEAVALQVRAMQRLGRSTPRDGNMAETLDSQAHPTLQ